MEENVNDVKFCNLDSSDLEYFNNYYGPGGIYENDKLFNVSWKEFEDAWGDIRRNNPNITTEFDSIAREYTRDQILYNRGYDIIGYISSPVDQYVGIKWLQKTPQK